MIVQLLLVLLLAALSAEAQLGCAGRFPVEIRGKHFFNTVTREYFPIKGIAYYPRPNSGLYDENSIDYFTDEYAFIWQRDIQHLQALNVNLVRIYAVDPGQSHDGFMCALRRAGIYVIVGLAAPCENCAISNANPPNCYPGALKQRGEFVIFHFSKYDNVLGFSAGNEVGLLPNSQGQPQVSGLCQKKFIRDMRAFINNCHVNVGMRKIPIGVVVADLDLEEKSLYYSCRSDPNDELENAEWYGLNTYRACDGSAKTVDEIVGYQDLLEEFQDFQVPIPVIFTEFGCVDPSFPTVNGFAGQRTFLDVEAFFTKEYLEEFTGGIVFEYSTEMANTESPYPFRSVEEDGNYGVVYFSPEDCDDIGIPCEVQRFPQFSNLAEAYDKVNITIRPPPYDGRPKTTECPAQFPPLSDYIWPSSNVDSMACPWNIRVDCNCATTDQNGLPLDFSDAVSQISSTNGSTNSGSTNGGSATNGNRTSSNSTTSSNGGQQQPTEPIDQSKLVGKPTDAGFLKPASGSGDGSTSGGRNTMSWVMSMLAALSTIVPLLLW